MLQEYKNYGRCRWFQRGRIGISKAVNVARRNDSELLLVHVIDTRAFQTISSLDGMMMEQASEMAKQTLADYQKAVSEAGKSSQNNH